MPAVLHGAEAGQQAADIAAFLAAAPSNPSVSGAPSSNAEGDSVAGGKLFGNLGCIACHSTPQSKVGNDFNRVPLHHVSAKWKPAALKTYLLDPQQYHAGSRMPKTPLSTKEADDITAFLFTFPTQTPPA